MGLCCQNEANERENDLIRIRYFFGGLAIYRTAVAWGPRIMQLRDRFYLSCEDTNPDKAAIVSPVISTQIRY